MKGMLFVMEEKAKEEVQNTKLDNEHIEKIEELETKKELPEIEEEKINVKVFENLVIADVVMLFLYFIALGALNIETNAFLTDLRVFSITLITFAIMLFEYSYRKENGNVCIHGIECLVLAIFTLISIYLYTLYFKKFHMIVASISFIFAVYYVGKSIIIYRKMKKQYIDSLNDINEIVKK